MKWTGSSAPVRNAVYRYMQLTDPPACQESSGGLRRDRTRRFGVAVPKRFGESAFIAAAPQGSGRAASRQHATGKDF
eukprot:tig00000841_g4722.t1